MSWRVPIWSMLVGLLLLRPPPSHAHAFLDHAEPRVGSSVDSPPSAVQLHFTEPIEPAFCRLEVMDAAGQRVDTPAPDAEIEEPDGSDPEEPSRWFVWRQHPSLRAGKMFRLDFEAKFQEARREMDYFAREKYQQQYGDNLVLHANIDKNKKLKDNDGAGAPVTPTSNFPDDEGP